ncbi:hypothetical protein OG381_36965 [Streptomyces sp. NBC_00490]|uniref:hypothetical protein n=1 Tax=Streptomyces sp. NBC_00490 TaxID=2903657 RepID=UPI002E1900C4
MRYTVWDPHAVRSFDRANLTQQQRALAEGVLRALEPGTYLSEHVAGANSAVLALTRSHHVLESHARVDQPRVGLTRTVLAQALSDVEAAVPAHSVTPNGAFVIGQAQQLLTLVNSAMVGSPTRVVKQTYAKQLEALVQPVASAVRSALATLWNGAVLTPAVAGQIRGQVAVLVALEGRDGLALRDDLVAAFNRGPVDAAKLAAILWPARKQYRVALTVSGTRLLEELDRLLPGAAQWPLVGPALPPGVPRSPAVRGLVTAVIGGVGSGTLVQVPVQAADAHSAIAQARRELTETLDQYAAGQRLLDLGLSPLSVVIDPTNRPLLTESRVSGGKSARPLTSGWSASLRPALRMANLAGQVDAPVASVALAWSAIESIGVTAADFETIAKACALHSVRQQLLSVYKSVTDSANAQLRHTRWYADSFVAVLAKAERSLAAADRGTTAAAQEAASRLTDSLAGIRRRQAEAQVNAAQLEKVLAPAIAVVRQNLLQGGDRDHPCNMSSWKLDLNDFLDAVLPRQASTPPTVQQTSDALTVLADVAGGLAREQLTAWQHRLAAPSALVDWLKGQQELFHGLLAWMYASRNLAIHTGQFSLPADILTAHAGRGIADLILEFLGHWHQDQRGRGLPDDAPRDIVIELAGRRDELVQHLGSAASCHPLNVATISAPYRDCWHRT